MIRKFYISFLIIILCIIKFIVVYAINIDNYMIYKISKLPNEYILRNDDYKKEHLNLRPNKEWILYFNSEKYLKTKITGQKKDKTGFAYSVSALYLVIKGKERLIDKDCYSYGRVTWDKKGEQFIYQRCKLPPADVSIGDICLVKVVNWPKTITKHIIIKKIGLTDFGWNEDENIVAFADFTTIYLLNTTTRKYKQIRGEWSSEVKEYHKGKGYPRWCNSFVWLKNDLYFSYMPNMNIRQNQFYYKIIFR